ncbi:MAG: carbon-nitrogen hydrolase family protein [Acidimicrobiales bacterium]
MTVSSAGQYRVAVVQRPPALLDREASVERAVATIDEAVGRGARLVTFPEAFVPGYPEYIWRLRPGDDYDLSRELHGRLIASAVDLAGPDLDPIREAAVRHGIVVTVGVHERDGAFSRATLYNTLVTIGADGSILNRHRKLVPTNPERMIWAPGDASGLRVVESPLGRLGGLICWENYMPLARFALYAQGIQLYVASTWDDGDVWLASVRHIAAEGRCWVLGSGCAIQARDIPASFPERDRLYPDPDEWLNPGDSVIVAPGGEVVAGPLHAEHGILYADCDPAVADASHYTLDAAGHYNRPDIFSLSVRRHGVSHVAFDEGPTGQGVPSPRDTAPVEPESSRVPG